MKKRPPDSIEYRSVPLLILRECEPLSRQSGFSYQCNGCGRCCMTSQINVSRPEIEMLSSELKMEPDEFVKRFTVNDGNQLARNDTGCVFLSPEGCSVYSSRPLACRLYPLRWHPNYDGQEAFSLLEPDPATKGEYGTNGTVGTFLEQQGCAALMKEVTTAKA